MNAFGTGPGTRIVKPRTAKQRAVTAKAAKPICFDSPTAGLPIDSWWTQSDSRADFDQRVAKEAVRMKDSKFGRASGTVIWEEGRQGRAGPIRPRPV